MQTLNFRDMEFTEGFVKTFFASLPGRLRHILVIADRVRQAARDINEQHIGFMIDESLAYCAALLHDVGYLEITYQTGFHPIDGAQFLEAQGFPEIARLIVGHSTGRGETARTSRCYCFRRSDRKINYCF